eukprot:COSAG01_NODE_73626_length_240_cov_13.872340_1_plen_68_part_10
MHGQRIQAYYEILAACNRDLSLSRIRSIRIIQLIRLIDKPIALAVRLSPPPEIDSQPFPNNYFFTVAE